MNVFYNTNFNDIIKNKIDYFIKFYSDGKNFKKVAWQIKNICYK